VGDVRKQSLKSICDSLNALRRQHLEGKRG
jgi:hypothetical protein